MTGAEQEPDQAGEKLWRAEQVAQRFEISRSKTFELLKEGRLRSVRIGGSRRIPESAVREFLAGLESA
jgi:excisionase family DNA binding protein